jgi:major type 1 subunit fimbrin (pilin)
MKKAALAAVVAAAMVPAFASAADLTINFTGTIIAQTCTVNGGNSSLNVAMPTIGAAQFKQAGDVAGTTPFQVQLTNCPSGVTQVRGLFELGPNVNTSTGDLKIAAATTGKATNVEIRLLDSTASKVRADGGQTPPVAVSSGNATISMYSQYVATANSVTAGKTDTSVGFTIAYN